ncbi:MAG TPA: PPC domain-containing DNA-binding protein [Fimbriiglobus sp.]|nr:PPC domain-containing DNA-binding protein [Fimbriiglobus sp.]
MRVKLLADDTERTFALIFDVGDEVMSLLGRFAAERRPRSAHFTAIGAFSDAVLAYFDWETKKYREIPVDEQVEVLTLAGDIAWREDGEPVVHAHVVVGRSDGTTRGGHLKAAHVRPTLELILIESPRHLERRHDPETGLALIRV